MNEYEQRYVYGTKDNVVQCCRGFYKRDDARHSGNGEMMLVEVSADFKAPLGEYTIGKATVRVLSHAETVILVRSDEFRLSTMPMGAGQ